MFWPRREGAMLLNGVKTLGLCVYFTEIGLNLAAVQKIEFQYIIIIIYLLYYFFNDYINIIIRYKHYQIIPLRTRPRPGRV